MSATDLRQRLDELGDRRVDLLDTGRVELAASSVLLLLWADGDDTYLALTRRATGLRAHGGQVSLPGGRVEPGESVAAAAVREAGEELGLDAETLEVVGLLDQAWTGAGYLVSPVVAWSPTRPVFAQRPARSRRQ